jgi:hypothetical protein
VSNRDVVVTISKRKMVGKATSFVFFSGMAVLSFATVASVTQGQLSYRPDALLEIDLNRNTVVEKILRTWGAELPQSQVASFRMKLLALRADRLLAANVSGSFDGVLEIVERHESAPIGKFQVSVNTEISHTDQFKALGDPNTDLVYTPISPCTIVDTRNVGGIVSANSFRSFDAINVAGNFASQGGNGSSDCGIPAGAKAIAASVSIFSTTTNGYVTLYPVDSGLPFSVTALFNNSAIVPYNDTSAIVPLCVGTCSNGKEFNYYTAGSASHVLISAVGYFKSPSGLIGDITEIQTAAASGLIGGVASGVAALSLAPTQLLPTTACAANQIAKWNGSAWVCGSASATDAWVQGGNGFGAAGVIGTTDAQDLTVTSGKAVSVLAGTQGGLRIAPSTNLNLPNAASVINGSFNNSGGAFAGATISGGGSFYSPNLAAAEFATIGGGSGNSAGNFGTVSGGSTNNASGTSSTISGGASNTASGAFSTVAGGLGNLATQFASFAAGNNALALHSGSFVWGDSTQVSGFNNTAVTSADNQFVVRAKGGVQLRDTTTLNFAAQRKQSINLFGTEVGIGVQDFTLYQRSRNFAWYFGGTHEDGELSNSGGFTLMTLRPFSGPTTVVGHAYAQSFNNNSDRAMKEAVRLIKPADVLQKLVAMPISSWVYKTDKNVRHIGPMAQDFHKAFGLGGSNDKNIATVDADGVALAAIQGLNQKLVAESKAKDAKISALERANEAIQRELNVIKKKLGLQSN